jgi:hypothetical protein
LLSKFATYLSTKARKYFNEKNELIQYASAAGYFSSIKIYFISKLPDQQTPPALSGDSWKSMSRSIRTIKTRMARKENKPLLGKKEQATEDNKKALAACCYWDGTYNTALFVSLFHAMVYCGGRGSEVAISRFSNLYVSEVKEKNGEKFHTLKQVVDRCKVDGIQHLHHFVHSCDVLSCYVFSIFYMLLIADRRSGQDDMMFGHFADQVINEKTETESKISNSFTYWWKFVYNLSKKYMAMDESISTTYCLNSMSSKKGAHSGKKRAAQELGDAFGMPPQFISFRCGWDLKSFHSFFDYWVGSNEASIVTARVLGGWKTQVGSDKYIGGRAPKLLPSCPEEKKQIDHLCKCLLGHQVHVSEDVKMILIANGIRFYDDFVDFLRKEPGGE